MVYIAIAAVWCLLAFTALAICRLAAISDETYALELAERVVRESWRRREPTGDDAIAERPLGGHREARRAAG